MSLTAYVRIRGSYIEEPVTYDLGPVWVTKSLIDGFYTKTGFRPQATAVATEGGISGGAGYADQVIIGDGGLTTGLMGPYVNYTEPQGITLATPDEMLPSQALRDRVYNMDYLTFYGPAAEGKTVTGRSTNTLTLATGHGLYNGQLVTLTTTTTLPAGLTANTLYYIVSRTATAVSFALTPGGSAVTISDAGTGTHKIVPFTVAGEFARNLNPRWSNGQGRLVA
jgi:hypothetical protein